MSNNIDLLGEEQRVALTPQQKVSRKVIGHVTKLVRADTAEPANHSALESTFTGKEMRRGYYQSKVE